MRRRPARSAGRKAAARLPGATIAQRGARPTTSPQEPCDQTAGFGRLDLAAIAREVVDLFDPTAEVAAVRLRFSESGPVSVSGDRDLLFDAIANLIDNAIKHGGRGGEVTVTVEPGASRPVLVVTDRGPGIPDEEHEHVLQRFYRLERSRHGPGSGLGLSLVAAVAMLHRAEIEMTDNRPGLRIVLAFPKSPPASQRRDASASAA